jgi:hypothetical protein
VGALLSIDGVSTASGSGLITAKDEDEDEFMDRSLLLLSISMGIVEEERSIFIRAECCAFFPCMIPAGRRDGVMTPGRFKVIKMFPEIESPKI